MSAVAANDLSKRFHNTVALDQVSIDFADGEFFALLGPSGSGKTTLLRCIAGFVAPDSGSIRFDNVAVENIPVYKRDIGMVFQNYALFPHMSVFDNIAFGLAVRGIGAKIQRERVTEMLRLIQLEGVAKRKPRQLSGGQQQRVALARALITRPQVLLLDEPLGALDKRLRQEMQIELKKIQRELAVTTIFVTHDQEEALTLSDRVAIIDHGRLIQMGTPEQVYEQPNTVFVADFLGSANFLQGVIKETNSVCLAEDLNLKTHAKLAQVGNSQTLAVRAEKIQLFDKIEDVPETLANRLMGDIEDVIYAGSNTTYIINLANISEPLTVISQNQAAHSLRLNQGTQVIAAWSAKHTMPVQS